MSLICPRCGGLLVRDLWLTFAQRVAVDARSLIPATTVSHIEFEAVVLDELTLFVRKVLRKHLVQEELTGVKKMLHLC
jgi:chorismate-pyruvate lyase